MKNKYSKKYIIETAIGLQDVDNLKNSEYFLNESDRYIKGEITLEELNNLVSSYYKNKPSIEDRSEEADKVSARIGLLISEDSFTFSVSQLLLIHRFLFQGVLESAGELRTYNISKKEWVLDGASVTYGDYHELELTLEYDFAQEKSFSYKGLLIDKIIEHLAVFVANLWQIHAFMEGNTRTVVVFFIKYLRSLGFDITNDTFAKNAWYFRNALVRANYTNISKGIYEDYSYLIKFLRNLLLGERNALKNRELHVNNRPIIESTGESKVLALIKSNSSITSEEISKSLNISIRTVKTILKSLAEKNIIKRTNGKRYGYWEIL